MNFFPRYASLYLPRLSSLVLAAILSFLALPLFAQVPVVTSSLNASGKVGAAFTYRIKANNKPTQFTATGMPKGLKLNAKSGVISGTPTKSGTFKINISARNAKGASKTVILVINVTSKNTAQSNMVTVKGGKLLHKYSLLFGQTVAAFQIGKYEVTWGEWKEVRAWAVANGYTDLADVGDTYPSGMGDKFPVSDVSWYDAVKWCNAKSQKEGLKPVYQLSRAIYRSGDKVPTVNSAANGYRLPLDKEWEWAARGGVSSKGYTYSGSNDVNSVAWFSSNSGGGTKAVGMKGANELGIYDMSGNVYEWCGDLGSSLERYMRGGAYGGYSQDCAVDVRSRGSPQSSSDTGFRLARNAP